MLTVVPPFEPTTSAGWQQCNARVEIQVKPLKKMSKKQLRKEIKRLRRELYD